MAGANGAIVEFRSDTAGTFNNTLILDQSGEVRNARVSATAPAAVTHTLGNLTVNGARRLTVSAGTTGVTASTPYGFNLGTTTLSGGAVTYNVGNNGTATGTLTLTGAITGGATDAVVKTGAGNLLVNAAGSYGNAANGTTLLGGTLTSGVANALPTTTPVVFGDTSASTAALNLGLFSQTVSALTVRSNSATANTIAVGAGATLTVTGGMTLGIDSGAATQSKLTVSGAGAMAVTGGNVQVGVSQATPNAANNSVGTLDLSGLTGAAGFSATVTNFNVGQGNSSGGFVSLTNTANAVTATTLNVGNSNGNNAVGTNTLTLGTGTNVLRASTFNVGISKAPGTVTFASQTAGSPGTVSVTDTAGTGPAAITLGSNNGTGTGAIFTGTLDLRGHTATVTAGTLAVGIGNNTLTGSTTGALLFDAGTFTATAVTLGSKSGSGGTGTAAGSITVGGGVFSVNAGGSITMATSTAATGVAQGTLTVTGWTVTVTGGITAAGSTVAGGTATGVLNLNGGVLQVAGNITNGAAVGTTSGTLSFNGGTLQAGANNATFVQGLTTATTSTSGTIDSNGFAVTVAQVVGGAGTLVKAGAGTLSLTGNNTYGGTTTVSAGTLQLGNATAAGSFGTGNVVNNATVVFNRSNAYAVANAISGTVTQCGTGTTSLNTANTYAGATTVSAGRLNVNGSITSNVTVSGGVLGGAMAGPGTGTISGTVAMSSGTVAPGNSPGILNTGSVTFTGGTFQAEVTGPAVGTQYDQLNVTGTVALGTTTQLSLPTPTFAAGSTYTIINNDLADNVTGYFLLGVTALAEGAEVDTFGGVKVYITYAGGDGNDVQLLTSPTFNGTAGADTIILRQVSGAPGTYEIKLNTDPYAPLGAITTLTVNGQGGNDTFIIDGVFGNPFPAGGITYNGGPQTGTPGDTLQVVNGTYTTITHNFTTDGTGSTDFNDGSSTRSVAYTGLEPVLVNVGSVADVVFNLPAAASTAVLEDDGTGANGLSRLRSTTGTFEVTTFNNPTGSVTINRGTAAESLTVTAYQTGPGE